MSWKWWYLQIAVLELCYQWGRSWVDKENWTGFTWGAIAALAWPVPLYCSLRMRISDE